MLDFDPSRHPSTAREGRSAHGFDMIDARTKERSKVFVGILASTDAFLTCRVASAAGRGLLACLCRGIDRVPLLALKFVSGIMLEQ